MPPRSPPPGPITLAHRHLGSALGDMSLAIVRKEKDVPRIAAWVHQIRQAADELEAGFGPFTDADVAEGLLRRARDKSAAPAAEEPET